MADLTQEQLIDHLSNLTVLALSDNQITNPRPLASLPLSTWLLASDNPVEGVPLELFKGDCVPALVAYYRELDKGSEPNRIVKVLLVGNGCVGKTTLAHCLAHGEPPATPIADRTFLPK